MINVVLTEDELQTVIWALGSEMLHVDWAIKRASATGRSISSAELAVAGADLVRITERLTRAYKTLSSRKMRVRRRTHLTRRAS